MLISHKYRTVFVHNPKVAGTTIRNVLLPHAEEDAFHFSGLIDDQVVDLSHPRMDQWPEQLWELHQEGYFFFGVVRDPVDRFQSAMSEFQFQQPEFIQQSGHADLQVFLNYLLSPALIKYDWRFTHFCPQWSYFFPTEESTGCGSESPPTYASHSRRRSLVTILRFEQMDKWWEPLWTHVGFSETPELKNARPSFYRPSSLTPETLRTILTLYRQDLFRFGYRDTLATLLAKVGSRTVDDYPVFPFDHANHGTRIEAVHRNTEIAKLNSHRLNSRELRALRERPQLQMTSVGSYSFERFVESRRLSSSPLKELPNELKKFCL